MKDRLVIALVRDRVLEIDDEGFLDRVSWDGDTGRFTIRRLHSGIYSVNQGGKSESFKLRVYGRSHLLSPCDDLALLLSPENANCICVEGKDMSEWSSCILEGRGHV